MATGQTPVLASQRARDWKHVFFRATGFGAGFGAIFVGLLFCGLWWTSRPKPPKPWNAQAIKAQFAGMSFRADNDVVKAWIKYSLENTTENDFHLQTRGTRVLVRRAYSEAPEPDDDVVIDTDVFVPAKQRVQFSIVVPFSITGDIFDRVSLRNDEKKMDEFTNRHLADLEDFLIFDEVNRFKIVLPNGWNNWKGVKELKQIRWGDSEEVKADTTEWQSAGVQVMCSGTNNLIPMYALDGKTKNVSAGCSLKNISAKAIPFNARPPKFTAVLQLPNGKTLKPPDVVYLASAQTEIPHNGEIKGGLFINHECDIKMDNPACLAAGLLGAKELLLTDASSNVRYHIRITP